jgi:addiction module RelB/DinJ family antitoxin
MDMNTTSLHIKIEPDIKREAQKTAEELGLSLSAVTKALLKQFIRTKRLSVSTRDLPEIPNAYLRKALKQSEEDEKSGRVSPGFTNVKDAIAWLDDPEARLQNGDKVH